MLSVPLSAHLFIYRYLLNVRISPTTTVEHGICASRTWVGKGFWEGSSTFEWTMMGQQVLSDFGGNKYYGNICSCALYERNETTTPNCSCSMSYTCVSLCVSFTPNSAHSIWQIEKTTPDYMTIDSRLVVHCPAVMNATYTRMSVTIVYSLALYTCLGTFTFPLRTRINTR